MCVGRQWATNWAALHILYVQSIVVILAGRKLQQQQPEERCVYGAATSIDRWAGGQAGRSRHAGALCAH